jgi:hypothetical protein
LAWAMIANVPLESINKARKVVTGNTYSGMNADTGFFAHFGDGRKLKLPPIQKNEALIGVLMPENAIFLDNSGTC